MAEEKKAVCNMTAELGARVQFKNDAHYADVIVTFIMSDVPVGVKDDQISSFAIDAISKDIEKGTGILRCKVEGLQSFIAVDSILMFSVKSIKIKKGE